MKKLDLILTKAKTLFAQKGFDATTMDEIAREAEVNKALIYYYFKDKESLYEEIFKIILKGILDKLYSIKTYEPREALFEYVKAFCEYAKEDEAFFKILMYEISSSGKHLPDLALELLSKATSFLDEILKEGINRGVFKNVNTLTVHFLIVGTVSFTVCSRNIRNTKSKTGILPEFLTKEAKSLCDEIFNIIVKGLER
ncbi:TetR/AcrR family transcriptional regulator [Hippea maritima]|uniref:Transcriptional regulator, TetR family n=1 Tax=Hippea maritima (strain ATCC 700847 / DSM 10411 / MH2) TaxID=760142 RepID=F2LY53_HIPMA|nr:TetR/AcrR family transcriptional regulator [Hippea maritima]AEA34376.1 transcriptional regulator, TetR family [Hippea maritima DSM 10411]